MDEDFQLPDDEAVTNPHSLQNHPQFQFPISENLQSSQVGYLQNDAQSQFPMSGNFQSLNIVNLILENNDLLLNKEILDLLESKLQMMRIEAAARQQIGRQQVSYFNLISLEQARSNIVSVAKDQRGSYFLTKKLDERNPQEIALILWEILQDDLHELMMHNYGNQVCQKMFEVLNDEQMASVVHLIVLNQQKFVDVCVHSYGTHSMQKLIEHLRFPDQLPDLINAIKENIVALATVLNGGYVIQKCVMIFSPIVSKEIFDQLAIYCVEISTHKDGCSVIQKCLNHAHGSSMVVLVQSIVWFVARLADDPFGNYVVQYVIKSNNAYANALIVHQLRGKYVELSTNKYASNVVEDLLQYCDQSQIALIIQELMDSSSFLYVLQDPFGNYVVQRALRFSKGVVHNALWHKIMFNDLYLRSDPYGKRVLASARVCRPPQE